MLAGLLYLGGITAVTAAVIAVVLYGSDLARLARTVGRRLGVIAPDPPSLPEPVERLARDVQRIRADLATMDPHTPVARRRGVLAAYDDALADACRALGIPDTLSGVADGVDREVARLEVEERLIRAGLIPDRTPGP
ncbi:MAG: hypothetical protein ACRDO4_03120 [Nocardioides sp.]